MILCISPFLRAIVVKKNHSIEFTTLWNDSHVNRGPLVSTIRAVVVPAISFVTFIIANLFEASIGIALGIAVLAVLAMVYSRRLKRHSIFLECRFIQNLRYRDLQAEHMGEKKPAYAGRLLSQDIHLTSCGYHSVANDVDNLVTGIAGQLRGISLETQRRRLINGLSSLAAAL